MLAYTHQGFLAVVLAARLPLIVADIILIYITWAKLSSRDMLRAHQKSKRLSLSDILFRDGTSQECIFAHAMKTHETYQLNVDTGTIYFVYVLQ